MAAAVITNVGTEKDILIDSLTSISKTIFTSNPSLRYCVLQLYVGATLIDGINIGSFSDVPSNPDSGILTLNATQIDDLLALSPNSLTLAATWKLSSYTTDARTTQDGITQEYSLNIQISPSLTALKPTFLDFDIENVDKSVPVIDKYGNTLVTSSTNTLIGTANTNIIPGISKVKVVVDVTDKAVANYHATMDHYVAFASIISSGIEAETSQSGDYSAVADVEIEIDNIFQTQITVSAYDSRTLSTPIIENCSLRLDYANVTISAITLTRDNSVDATTKLAFTGLLWKKYFSSGTTSNPGYGVLNTLTAAYRYKETTVAWGAQSWTTITPTVDASGNISFDSYINGDLGGSGFDTSKSYNIEVRVFDKLSQMIVEGTLNVGIPIQDWTPQGTSIMKQYDTALGGDLQVATDMYIEATRLDQDIIRTGWLDPEQTATYQSSDSPSHVISIAGDQTARYSVGMKFKMTQANANLKAYYRFESGALATDDSSVPKPLTAVGTPTSITGKFGGGVSFNGSNGYSYPAPATNYLEFRPAGAFTVGLWMKTSTTGATQTLFQQYSQNTAHAGYQLLINSSNLPVFKSGANTGVTQGTHWQQIIGTTNVCDGKWHHVVGVYDGATLKIIIDGATEGSIAWATAPAYAGFNSYLRFACGNITGTGTNINFYTGYMDDFFLLNGTALTEAEIYTMSYQGQELGVSATINEQFFVTKIQYDGTDTFFTLFGGVAGFSVSGTISDLRYSRDKAPHGFILDEDFWSVEVLDTGNCAKASPTQNTWYGDTGTSATAPKITVPIGKWELMWDAVLNCAAGTTVAAAIFGTLSTANNSETNLDLTAFLRVFTGTSETRQIYGSVTKKDIVKLNTKTDYFLDIKTDQASAGSIAIRGDLARTKIRAKCAYL